jgi:peptidoglycan-associated lipoprotein
MTMMNNLKFCLVFFCFCFSTNGFSQDVVTLDTSCFNTPYDDFGFRRIGTESYIVSAARRSNGRPIIDDMSRKPYTDLYNLEGCQMVGAELFSARSRKKITINSSHNDGPLSANKDGSLVFFTNNGQNLNGYIGIYWCTKSENGWSRPEYFPLNSDIYNVTHPFYDEENSRLYFTSDMGEGTTGFDIYYCSFDGRSFGHAIAVKEANSPGTELFPVVHANQLYFTSNSFNSSGGLDLFVLMKDSVHRLQEPFNSKFDDLAIFFTGENTGFFSSNRLSKGNNDDIMSFIIRPELNKDSIKAVQNLEFLNASLEKQNIDFNDIMVSIDTLKMPANLANLLKEEINSINESKEIHAKNRVVLESLNNDMMCLTGFVKEYYDAPSFGDSALSPKFKELTCEVINIMAKKFLVKNVQFAFDKSTLSAEYTSMLETMILLLKGDQTMNITLVGHTDSKGSAKYNMLLSQRRAQEVKDYLVAHGIKQERVIVNFYGLSRPIASNDTEEGRAKNRRVEMLVTDK